MALGELQDQKPFGAHWSRLATVWRCEVEKKHRAPFQEQIPCKLEVILKRTLQIPLGS